MFIKTCINISNETKRGNKVNLKQTGMQNIK